MIEIMLPSQTLPDFRQYLVSRKLVRGKSVTFYTYWANRYLTFSKRLKNADAVPQVEVCFLRLPPGFPAVPQYFDHVSVGPLLNQLDFPDFA